MPAEIVRVQIDEQLQEALAIRKAVFVEEQNVSIEEEIDDYDSLDAESHHLLLQEGGQFVAAGRIKHFNEDSAKLQRVAVLMPFRSKGYGRVLILAMEELARELGFKYAVLDGQVQAEGFYRKLGYEVISEEPFYDANILHVRMQKKL
ncbi:GNAT family N-acetyltransferase [Paenibacillus sp. JX-17]|uniref:GNAT family N-acetyltransferase n=1 Tax=Paenibacillus lacisoli TaxID=3064525 RepID=A0ABT9C7S1_9BACL|nr:GNAT family N-acetyltransferase [Paenibacillus sp. JX-17]MDO7905301.1 GNAT family N-acetyltransferase [Paenibacillus sp. JX-17]